MKLGEKFILVGTILIIFLAGFVGYRIATKPAHPPKDYYLASPLADMGLAVMRRKGCNSCHLYMKNGEFGVAPVLDGEGTRRSQEWIKTYIANPQKIIEGSRHNGIHATDFKKGWTEEERQAVVAFLSALRANPGSVNYPKPLKSSNH